MLDATTNGLPVVEQRVLASSLPLLPFSGRESRMTVRTWGELRGMDVPDRLDFQMLSFIGCRAPMEIWVGDLLAMQVTDTAGFVEAIQIVDAPGGLTEAQAAALTEALGPPVVVAPTPWDHITATVWAWWPHVLVLAIVALYLVATFRLLRRVARAVARHRDARTARRA